MLRERGEGKIDERMRNAGGQGLGWDVLAALNECRQQTIESVGAKESDVGEEGDGGQVRRWEENRRNTLSRRLG